MGAQAGLSPRLNLSPSSALLLLEVKPGSEPPAFRSSNTALSSLFSHLVGLSPDRRAGGGCVVEPRAAVLGPSDPRHGNRQASSRR